MPTLYPPTGHFPASPQELERDILDEAYSELRIAYRGLMVSRGIVNLVYGGRRVEKLSIGGKLENA